MNLHPVLLGIPQSDDPPPVRVTRQRHYARLARRQSATVSGTPLDGWEPEAAGVRPPQGGGGWARATGSKAGWVILGGWEIKFRVEGRRQALRRWTDMAGLEGVNHRERQALNRHTCQRRVPAQLLDASVVLPPNVSLLFALESLARGAELQ